MSAASEPRLFTSEAVEMHDDLEQQFGKQQRVTGEMASSNLVLVAQRDAAGRRLQATRSRIDEITQDVESLKNEQSALVKLLVGKFQSLCVPNVGAIREDNVHEYLAGLLMMVESGCLAPDSLHRLLEIIDAANT
eukprot:m.51302 g.51302  ORF g.51302 m.51302 type:complete len:135 (-) comp12977_c0_seq1:148-552(-)